VPRIRDILEEAESRFAGFNGFVNEKFDRLSSSLQREVQEITTDLIVRGLQHEILEYASRPVRLRDGTTVQGQSGFDRLVDEDKNVYAVIERYRPSKLWYVRRARSIRDYIAWSSPEFARIIAAFLEENGIVVGERGLAYLERECDRWREVIYARRRA